MDSVRPPTGFKGAVMNPSESNFCLSTFGHRRASPGLVFVLALALAACGQSSPSNLAKARQTADVLSGDAAGAAADNPQCKMFTPAEIAAYGGGPVGAGANAAMGTGCQWSRAGGPNKGMVLLQVIDAEDHSPPSNAEGFKKLPDVGGEGFVVPQMGGWQAGAIDGAKSINVMTSGSSSSEAKTVAFLREAMKRSAAS